MAKNSVPGVTDARPEARAAIIHELNQIATHAASLRSLLADEGLYDDSGTLVVEYCDWRVRFNGKVAELTDVSDEVPF